MNKPANNLTSQLSKVKRFKSCSKRSCAINDPPICNAKNVVYKGICTVCKAFYIGSTSRLFHDRVAEHFQASRATSIFKHASTHSESPKNIFTFSVVSRHNSEIRCRIAEAMTIKNLNPSLNNREEFIDYTMFLI